MNVSVADVERLLKRRGGKMVDAALSALSWFGPDAHDSPEDVRALFKDMIELAETEEQRAQFRALAETPPAVEPYVPDIQLLSGNRRYATFAPEADIVVVDGDLHVDGLLESNHSHDSGMLIVLGELTAGNTVCRGGMFISGGCALNHLYANSTNDCEMVVGGDLVTQSVLEYGQHIEVHGMIRAQLVISAQNDVDVHGRRQVIRWCDRSMPRPNLLRYLRPELVETHEYTGGAVNDIEPGVTHYTYPNEDALLALLRSGASPLL